MDQPRGRSLLTLNGGSSSIKFALFDAEERQLAGKLTRLGTPEAVLTFNDPADGPAKSTLPVPAGQDAGTWLLGWLAERIDFANVAAVGHRVVHGLNHDGAARVTPALLAELRQTCEIDPDHMPAALALIEAIAAQHPSLLQVACFDTVFHRSLPPVARLLSLPRKYGLQRYGFHGLSYAYLVAELARLAGPAAAQGRLVLAHLGSGASLAAVHAGKSIDTTMGFSPTAGLVMGTRPGDLDPGACAYLLASGKVSVDQFGRLINHESGLLGVSETSSDMSDLLQAEATDPRAADAVALFCYQACKGIGAYAAALGGLDSLVFAGGIGENAPVIRQRICANLEFLGVVLDEAANAQNAALISSPHGRVPVRVIRTDEERMIARILGRFVAS